MSGSTSVPPPTIGPTGVVVPDEADILSGFFSDLNSAFGGNLEITNLETPQGQLASSVAALIGDKNNTFLYYVSQVDPAYAEGRMQDGIARIYFITRLPPQATTVTATIIGLPGTVIPVGALATATDGNLYAAVGAGTIPSGGSMTLVFACTVNGPIACPAGTLNSIYQYIPGWDSITNAADGAEGNNVESRGAFETRRYASVQQNATGSNQAMLGALLSTLNVTDAYVFDNQQNTPLLQGGITLPANSLFISVNGGADADVGATILSKKNPGCSFAPGTTTVVVHDQSYSSPQPAYNITFTRATPTVVLISVSIVSSPLVPTDAIAQIQAAVVSAFIGGDGGPKARIGSTIYASRFYAAVANLGVWAQVVSVLVGISTPTGFSVTMGITQIPVTATGDITVSFV